ncbi:hypothetical protein Goshw_008834 [Gossypium schwendimanii]|uniref:RNase H type-1 domain-containing protein n=1 Tax=Gossypium schwendimanii TaxID=34291 RepID=A0A7J9N2Q3_GOSSC|nr:hypothetical protein [Gossypium schwendimanii]
MGTSTGFYSIKSAYRKVDEWSWDIQMMLLGISHGNSKCPKELVHVHYVDDLEDNLHTIRDCPVVKSGKAALGGVLRDQEAKWISGYNRCLATKAIHDCSMSSSNSALIRRIHQMLKKVGNWFLPYIPRENNKDVDCMAKMAFDRKEGLVILEDPSRGISNALM